MVNSTPPTQFAHDFLPFSRPQHLAAATRVSLNLRRTKTASIKVFTPRSGSASTPGYDFPSQRHEGTKLFFEVSIDCSGDAIFHEFISKVEEKSKLQSSQLQIGQELLFVGGADFLHRL